MSITLKDKKDCCRRIVKTVFDSLTERVGDKDKKDSELAKGLAVLQDRGSDLFENIDSTTDENIDMLLCDVLKFGYQCQAMLILLDVMLKR